MLQAVISGLEGTDYAPMLSEAMSDYTCHRFHGKLLKNLWTAYVS